MARADINGIGIDYDLIGEGPLIAITPGGRFSKDTPGLRELAGRIAEGGYSVLIWDRPNCGASDICFVGENESALNGETLVGLIRSLDRGPALLVGISAGARVSLIAAARGAGVVRGLFLLWISGGPIGLANLAVHYYSESAITAATQGMEAVAALPSWKDSISRNSGNRDRLLAQDPKAFVATLQRWAAAFFPAEGSPVPGMKPSDYALDMPVTIVRSDPVDLYHTRETSDYVHNLIPGSKLVSPPWGEGEFYHRLSAQAKGEGLFAEVQQLAPQVLEFARSAAPATAT